MSLRRLRPFVALLAIASMLFMELAVAAYACPGLQASSAVATQTAADVDPACAGMDMADPALCHGHCHSAAQSLDKPAPPSVPPASCASLPVVFAAPLPMAAGAAGEPESLLSRSTAPPLAIRHCCFRI
jgi:hypothetical protein